jgi:quinol-cytochrome oxidoreductase complex cytochrome b subunit
VDKVNGGRKETLWSWLASLWADIKASTDPGLLGLARFIGLLYGPIERALPIDQALNKSLRYRMAPHVGWRHAFGGITYLLFMILVVTGVLLSFYYRPSPEEAYPSIQYIVSDVPMGWLVRGLHVWSANLIVVAVLAHMARVFFAGAYKPPRETNWVVGLILLFVTLGFGATGYLLPWDQWSYWTVTEVLDTVSEAPLMGFVVNILRGDVLVSGATLSRFFALHVVLLPWAAFALLVFHFILVRRQGIAPVAGISAEGREGIPFYPTQLFRNFIVGTLVLAITFSAAALFPRPVGNPANPFQLPSEIVSSWVVVDVSLALIRYLGVWGFTLFTLLGLTLAFLPVFDRNPEQRLRKRPVAVAIGLLFFGGFLVLWLLGRQLGSVPPSGDLRRGDLQERVLPRLPAEGSADGTAAEDAATEEPSPNGEEESIP